MKKNKKITLIVSVLIVLFLGVYLLLINKPTPDKIQYGVSFNTPYAYELRLDWKKVYEAVLTELDVNHLRLSAHWDLVEPEDDKWNFEELDYQVIRAKEEGADVIFGVGKRLPRWPECHVPDWAKGLTLEEQENKILEYIKVVVDRYKDYENIIMWQVENEAFLSIFAHQYCAGFDVKFLEEEIALVKSLDPTRQVLLTDSADLGLWSGPYSRGDLFGTTLYLYVWNEKMGAIKNYLPSSWYRAKSSLMEIFHGKKEIILIELSLEPWLSESVVDAPFETQLERMNPERFDEVLKYAKDTRMQKQYLWGAEWWYYMNENGYPEFWEKAKEVFRN